MDNDRKQSFVMRILTAVNDGNIAAAKEIQSEIRSLGKMPPLLGGYLAELYANLNQERDLFEICRIMIVDEIDSGYLHFESPDGSHIGLAAYQVISVLRPLYGSKGNFDLFKLGFLYLSNRVNNSNEFPNDWFARGVLIAAHQSFLQGLWINHIGSSLNPVTCAIGDFYKAYEKAEKRGESKKAIQALNRAQSWYEWLEDMDIMGNAANTYTLEEIADIGFNRNMILYKKIPGLEIVDSDVIIDLIKRD